MARPKTVTTITEVRLDYQAQHQQGTALVFSRWDGATFYLTIPKGRKAPQLRRHRRYFVRWQYEQRQRRLSHKRMCHDVLVLFSWQPAPRFNLHRSRWELLLELRFASQVAGADSWRDPDRARPPSDSWFTLEDCIENLRHSGRLEKESLSRLAKQIGKLEAMQFVNTWRPPRVPGGMFHFASWEVQITPRGWHLKQPKGSALSRVRSRQEAQAPSPAS